MLSRSQLTNPNRVQTVPRCLDLTTDGKQTFLHGMDPVGKKVQHPDSQLMADNPSDEDHTMDFYPWNGK